MRRAVAGALAELPVGVVAPGPEGAVRFDGKGMPIASRRHADRAELCGHRQGQALIVPELSVEIATPRPRRAVRFHGQAGIAAGGHELPVRGSSHLGGDVATSHKINESLPELTGEIGTPSPQRTIRPDGHRKSAASHEALPVGCRPDLGGIDVLAQSAIAQLPAVVRSPGPQGAVGTQRGGKRGPGGEAAPIRGGTDLHRGGCIDGGAVAKLAVGIDSPGPQAAIGLKGKSGIGSGDEALAGGFPGGEGTDLHRCRVGAGICRALAQLTVGVGAPAPEGAIGFYGHGVGGASSSQRPGGAYAYLHRGCARGGGAIAKLAAGIDAPSPQGAIGAHRHGMAAANAHGFPGRDAADLRRHGLGTGKVVADLRVETIAPAPQSAVGTDAKEHVIALAAGDLDKR